MPVTAGLGIILLGAAGYYGMQHWMSTRIVYPVDMPVSLAPGHVHTGPFRLNLNADYLVILAPGTDWRWDSAHPECNPYQHLQSRWVLYQNGKVVDRQDAPAVLPWYSSFSASSGTYELDLEVMSDFSCLDSVHPHLEVIAVTENYETLAFAARVALVIGMYIGLVLVIFVPIVRVVHSLEHSERGTDSASVGQNFQWARRLPLRRPISGLPGFGLVGGIIFAISGMVMMMLLVPMTPKGLSIHLLKPGAVPAKSDAWTEPLIVWVKYAGRDQEPRLILNSKEVAWEDLDRALKEELGRRREWLVYVGGDDGVSWQSVANVMDVARGDQAKVFLITGDTGRSR